MSEQMRKWEKILLEDYSLTPAPGHELIDLKSLGILPVAMGGAGGFNAEADIPATTADGVNTNQLWADYQRTLQMYRDWRNPFISLLTFNTTNPFDQVAAVGGTTNFEEASEYGEPVGVRIAVTPVFRGYGHKWYDLAARYTWRFLLKATSGQLDSINNAALEADTRLLFDRVMRTVFNNSTTNLLNPEGQQIHKFWNGVSIGGETPPDYRTNTFTATHNHFLGANYASSTGVAAKGDPAVPSLGLEDMYNHLRHHGYSLDNGYRIVLMANSVQTAFIRTFRAGVDPGPGLAATYDFIPAVGQPGLLIGPDVTAPSLGVNQVSAGVVPGLNTIGTYGNILIVEDDFIPTDYLFMFATGGTDNLGNPIGLRADPRLQGLQLVKGRTPDYPLIDSFYTHGLGAGVRNKGGGVVMQISAATTYTPPTAYSAA